jgi:hypothetical protein
MRIVVMKDSKTKAKESTRLAYTGLRHSCCHTHLDTSVYNEVGANYFLLNRNLRTFLFLFLFQKLGRQ